MTWGRELIWSSLNKTYLCLIVKYNNISPWILPLMLVIDRYSLEIAAISLLMILQIGRPRVTVGVLIKCSHGSCGSWTIRYHVANAKCWVCKGVVNWSSWNNWLFIDLSGHYSTVKSIWIVELWIYMHTKATVIDCY